MEKRLSTPIVWAICIALAILAIWGRPHLGVNPWIPSSSVLALLLGAVVVHLPGMRERFVASAKTVVKSGTPYAIILIGFGLSLTDLWKADVLGLGLVVVVVGMVVAFVTARLVGGLLGLDPRTCLLLGAGTAVCGNSAIMAVVPIVKPDDEDLAVSLGVINLLGLLMIFVLPPIASLLDIFGDQGGMLAGMTVHAVPQAIAAGEAFGKSDVATLYKLVRVALLMPTVLLLALFWSNREGKANGDPNGKAKRAKIPGFLWLFVVAVLIRSLGLLDWNLSLPGQGSQVAWGWLKLVGKFVLTAVMAAIGMGIYFPMLIKVGPRILVVGVAAVGVMTAVCGLLIRGFL